ncbi:MAG: hypothetical protein GDA54_07075 [Alphaproteobacteria bacterium GM7ARS4]|nr:hypothetical protein [Alphaproteobacteria bacterium GM7ARS4]
MTLVDMVVGEGWLPGLVVGAVLSFLFMVALGRSAGGRRMLSHIGFKGTLTSSLLGMALHIVGLFLFALMVALVMQASGWSRGFDEGWVQAVIFLGVVVSVFAFIWGHYTGKGLESVVMLVLARLVPVLVIASSLALLG